MVATVDGDGRNVVLALLMDYRGAYELLKIDAQTGKTTEHPLPFDNVPDDHTGDSPYASMLSSANKFYSHFGSHFIEFDPANSAFAFSGKTAPLTSMAFTEADDGVIWSVSYPQCGVVSFHPNTRAFKDYGQVYKQNWSQYPRGLAADDAGWIYIGTGETASQILILDPKRGKATPLLDQDQRRRAIAHVYRDEDGKVYAQAQRGDKEQWYALHKGEATKVDKAPNKRKRYIAGTEELNHNTFPDGGVVEECSIGERKLVVRPKGGERKTLAFDYSSEGAVIMGCAAASDGTICGGTSFPMSFFRYDPRADKMSYRPAYMQWNTIAREGDHFFVGGYPGGFLLDWEPGKAWVPTQPKDARSNPLYLTACTPTIHRPACLVPLTDGRTVIMGGTPDYGHTGGGLLFWDRKKKERVLLTDKQIIPDQSTQSILLLPDGKLLSGTTTAPGTGGEKKASAGELYIMDTASKTVEWHEMVLAGVQGYEGLHLTSDGLVYGIADTKLFFVFDPAKRQVIHKERSARNSRRRCRIRARAFS